MPNYDPYNPTAGFDFINEIMGRLTTCWYCKMPVKSGESIVRTRKGRIHSICHTKGIVELAKKRAEAK